MENEYIHLKTGTIETPDYFSRAYTFMPKKGEHIMVPVKGNNRTGEYEFDKEKFKKFEKNYSPKQKANLLIMYHELVSVYEMTKEKLKELLLREMKKKKIPF